MSDKLVRPTRGRGRMIAGVCGGLAARFGISVFMVRLLFLVFALAGAGEIVYLILWIVMPKASPDEDLPTIKA